MFGIKSISQTSCLTVALLLACATNSMARTAPLLSPPSPLMPGQRAASPSKPEKENKPALILQAKVTSVDKEFEHESFKMHSVVKASVFAFKPGDDQNKIGYERFWFHDGKAIGVEKRNNLDVPAGAAVQIHVVQTSLSSQHTKAAANVVMRLVLDTLIHKREVAGVTVSANAFSAISQELQFRNGHILPEGQDPPRDAHVIFELNAEASDQKQTFYWI
ncbi:MAG: hypothetical protein JST89_25740 [Cyanobacteria bacterium SZAS-4]|nr:hypothetical protein [Cyanobacteria bacterium SZAS-4]